MECKNGFVTQKLQFCKKKYINLGKTQMIVSKTCYLDFRIQRKLNLEDFGGQRKQPWHRSSFLSRCIKMSHKSVCSIYIALSFQSILFTLIHWRQSESFFKLLNRRIVTPCGQIQHGDIGRSFTRSTKTKSYQLVALFYTHLITLKDKKR